MDKSADAFRTISEVAETLDLPQHVLRFWETRFPQIKPLKRAGGRRFYRPGDIEILRAIKHLLYGEGYTIKGVQRLLKEQGVRAVAAGAGARGGDFGGVPGPDPNLAGEGEGPDEWSERSEFGQPAEAQARGEGYPPVKEPTAFGAADIANLRRALIELEDCERILESLRRMTR